MHFLNERKILFLQSLLIFYVLQFCNCEDNVIVSARIESCPGCQLKRLGQVREFIYVDVPQYDKVEWRKIQGAPPELLFLNEADEEVERHPLEKLNREECNQLLIDRGFQKKTENPKEL